MKFNDVKKPTSFLIELNPSASRLNQFDPFLDSLQIRYKYATQNKQCGTMTESINLRSVLYRKGEYVGYTRFGFVIKKGKVQTNLNMVLNNLGRCRDNGTLSLGKSKIPHRVTWRMAIPPYATVQYSNSRKHAKFSCSDGMILEDWIDMINSTEITHIKLVLTSKMSSEWEQCLKVYFKIVRGKGSCSNSNKFSYHFILKSVSLV
jgi:hypothetical protein